MPFLAQHLLEDKPAPVVIRPDATVSQALSIMIRHDYSQLPVTDENEYPLGMITYESILRGMRNFKTTMEALHVRDVMVPAPTFNLEDDLFELLKQLKLTNAVLILDPGVSLCGIVTSYDSTEYFRSRAENFMRIEDIETTIKEIIMLAFTADDGSVDEVRLADAIARVDRGQDGSQKQKTYDELTLAQYISMLTSKQIWPVVESVFQISKDVLNTILDGVRGTRNNLAHFRSELSPEEIDQLSYCADWVTKRWDDYQKKKKDDLIRNLFEEEKQLTADTPASKDAAVFPQAGSTVASGGAVFADVTPPTTGETFLMSIEPAQPGESRYAPLADWLQSQPGGQDQVALTFTEIEEIIGSPLPESARSHRAWWANDSHSHVQSILWLEAGWRRSYLNMSEEKVIFTRIRERERAYIRFYSDLFDLLRQKGETPAVNVSPDGTSFIVFKPVPKPSGPIAFFGFSFARGQRFRIDLYIDTGGQKTTKAIFDQIHLQREQLEAALGNLAWERIDEKRASRIALYHPGSITDDESKLAELRQWAADRMIAFCKTLEPVSVKAIADVYRDDNIPF